MDKAGRASMQARIVLVVYRSEMARLARIDISPSERLEWENALQRRSIDLLDDAMRKLGDGPGSHGDAKLTLAKARAEIAEPDAT
jgi:hypothetical protein